MAMSICDSLVLDYVQYERGLCCLLSASPGGILHFSKSVILFSPVFSSQEGIMCSAVMLVQAAAGRSPGSSHG